MPKIYIFYKCLLNVYLYVLQVRRAELKSTVLFFSLRIREYTIVLHFSSVIHLMDNGFAPATVIVSG